ncbi:MAG: ABC transporter ATP-binding protein [Oligoflexales bacterium]|nr:ABC transporter ATP-binding protein [Oligoflexales bacterium]
MEKDRRLAPIISIQRVSKKYRGGFQALKDVNLDIHEGEIFALLGPNGAGKTTLIGGICGTTNISSGKILVDGKDNVKYFRHTRSLIGLVPQEITLSAFETVWDNVNFSRGLFGKGPEPDYVEQLLKDLSLWDKKGNMLMTLSGGMKRRVMIAKALSHKPRILFLDEPSAGVDVELRRDMWQHVHKLRQSGVTIILTTHYIEEAEEMADRIGVINKGEIILVEKKQELMKKLGTKQMSIELATPLEQVPPELSNFEVKSEEGRLIYYYDPKKADTGVSKLIKTLSQIKLEYTDINTKQSSLEEIFVELVKK